VDWQCHDPNIRRISIRAKNLGGEQNPPVVGHKESSMRTTFSIFLWCLLIFFVSCSSSTKVHFDYDRQEDFSQFRTYNFIPVPEALSTEVNSMVIRRIEEAIALALGDKGFNRTEASPDFLIAIHLESKDKFDVQNWGYTYAPYDLYYRGSGY
jgi:hypothetical protein